MGKLFFYISLALFSFLPAMAGEKQPLFDSSDSLGVRSITEQDLSAYRGKKEFIYRTEEKEALSLWDRFWNWFWHQLDKATSKKAVRKWLDILIWTVSIGLILYAVYRLTGMEKRFLFRSSDSPAVRFTEANEDIATMDLPAAIAEAEQQGNYRLALRLQYLRSLKQLSQKGLITYTINKTNQVYARELTGTKYGQSFNRITWLYEFGWYGDFPIDRDMYERIRDIFHGHQQLVDA